MTRFSPNIAKLQPSATISLASRVRELIAEGRDIINLTAGEPDFPTPGFVADAGDRAIREGRTRYTAAAGIPELRAAIARNLERLSPKQGRIDPAGVVVSAGAKESLFNLCFSLFGPGDRVLIPVPYWTTYGAQVELARAEPVYVQTREENDYKPTVDELEAAAAQGASGLLLNSPNNPSGAVFSLEELEAIVRWAAERDIWVISDEIYRRIYRDEQLAPGLLDLDPALLRRAIVVDGASKAFAMTGWRIGFSYGPKDVAAKVAALQSQTTSHAATPSQYAALAAFIATDEQMEEYRTMSRAFEKRRRRTVELFRERLPQVSFVEPQGAFYLWVRTDGLARPGEDSAAVCERLLEEAGVALVPGEAFGDDRYVRLSYACSEEVLEEAVHRLARVVG
jgi:aspartate aminotransferase